VISYTAPEAADLAEALNTATPAIDTALENGDYPTALDTLAGLRAPIDTFFEGVMVNSDVADERARRLGLLIEIEATFRRIADFSRLDG
jgi:glycyl-tRNA synthetase beta chain